MAFGLLLPATADTLYSGLLNTSISTDFTGVFVTIDGGVLNPFFGGVGVANNNLLQPARTGTGSLDSLMNFGLGATIDSSIVLASANGYGGSQTHVGTTFTAGQEGYLGFKLNGVNYGWMRVVFTNNTGGALIKDWAYDNTGGGIATGNVLQSGSTLTLNSAMGSFNYGSQVTGSNNLEITGSGTVTLSQQNTYTGTTNVTAGKLVVNGNTSTSSLTTIQNGATLGGSGTVGKTVVNGTLAVGNSPGQMNFTDTLGLNGTTVMEIDGMAGAGVTGGHDFINLTGSGAAGVITYGGALTLDIGTLFSVGSYSWNLFDMASTSGAFQTISLVDQYSGNLLDHDFDGVWNLVSDSNTWRYTASDGVLSLTVVPEPSATLLGCMATLSLLRRRRGPVTGKADLRA